MTINLETLWYDIQDAIYSSDINDEDVVEVCKDLDFEISKRFASVITHVVMNVIEEHLKDNTNVS